MLELYVYTIKIEGNDMAALSLLPPDIVQKHGLPAAAVFGEVDPRRPEMTIDGFTPNEDFLALLNSVIATHATTLESVQKQLTKVKNGPVYVVDRRTVNKGGLPPFEDILGWFAVRDGEIIPDSFNPSPNYQLLSNNGPIELESELEEKLVDAVYDTLEPSADA
jgi:hypothetical protein